MPISFPRLRSYQPLLPAFYSSRHCHCHCYSNPIKGVDSPEKAEGSAVIESENGIGTFGILIFNVVMGRFSFV
ncbi:hypothetical protein GQ457_08G035370 [Hibiscus cannabinus]